MEAARRRAIRKRKILQNAEDRIKKLTGNFGSDVKHEENFDKQTYSCEGNALKLDDVNDERIERENVNIKYNFDTGAHQDKPTETQDKTDGYIYRKDGVHEAEKQNIDENLHDQTTQNDREPILDVIFPKHEQEPTEIQDTNKTDGYVRKERVPETINEKPVYENGIELNPEFEAVDSKVTNVRPVVVIVFATFCFTKSLYFPVICSILGSPWFLEIYNAKEFSFIIPFCLLEIVLFFTPTIRKVMPGKQVNIWLLALKLCGVPPGILDTAKIVILEILEFLTDLAMFIFVLVILQNMKELM